MKLHIQILNIFGILLYELAPRLNFVTHQNSEGFISCSRIFQRNSEHNPGVRVHGCFPKLLGVHFTKTFVPLNFRSAAKLRNFLVSFSVRISVIMNFIFGYSVKRRLSNVNMALLDNRPHEAEEEGQCANRQRQHPP